MRPDTTLPWQDTNIIIPCKNESGAIGQLVQQLRDTCPGVDVIVVDDGSTDGSGELAARAGARVVRHPYSMGNGAAIKSGARAAHRHYLLFMDADGQHTPEAVTRVCRAFVDGGVSMMVGARNMAGQATLARGGANYFYNRFSSWMAGHRIEDLTSGLRMVERLKFMSFIEILPNTFSYPTTITMAFFRAGFAVGYCPIEVKQRIGRSHIKPMQDGIRFLLIIFKIGTLYSPLKLFLPVSLLFLFSGLGYYGYTFLENHRFTNMSALLISTSVLVFLIGLVSEQITTLFYRGTESSQRDRG